MQLHFTISEKKKGETDTLNRESVVSAREKNKLINFNRK